MAALVDGGRRGLRSGLLDNQPLCCRFAGKEVVAGGQFRRHHHLGLEQRQGQRIAWGRVFAAIPNLILQQLGLSPQRLQPVLLGIELAQLVDVALHLLIEDGGGRGQLGIDQVIEEGFARWPAPFPQPAGDFAPGRRYRPR